MTYYVWLASGSCMPQRIEAETPREAMEKFLSWRRHANYGQKVIVATLVEEGRIGVVL